MIATRLSDLQTIQQYLNSAKPKKENNNAICVAWITKWMNWYVLYMCMYNIYLSNNDMKQLSLDTVGMGQDGAGSSWVCLTAKGPTTSIHFQHFMEQCTDAPNPCKYPAFKKNIYILRFKNDITQSSLLSYCLHMRR